MLLIPGSVRPAAAISRRRGGTLHDIGGCAHRFLVTSSPSPEAWPAGARAVRRCWLAWAVTVALVPASSAGAVDFSSVRAFQLEHRLEEIRRDIGRGSPAAGFALDEARRDVRSLRSETRGADRTKRLGADLWRLERDIRRLEMDASRIERHRGLKQRRPGRPGEGR